MKKIKGRQEETIWFENDHGEKDFIHPIVFVEFYIRGLKRFQIVQTEPGCFCFKAVIDDDYNQVNVKKHIEQRLRQILWQKQMSNVNFKIKVVNNIKQEKSTGKYKLIKKDL